jgi:hypothetical protein
MPRHFLRTVMSSACVVAMVACGAAGADIGNPEDGAGVQNHVPAWTQGAGWVVDTTPEVSIGQLDGPDEYNLHGVVAAVRLLDGRIALANRGTRNVRLYSAAGEHLRTFGREGDGPGEFRWINWMGAGAADSLYVWDGYHARLSVFTAAGDPGRSVRVEGIGFPSSVEGMMGDGSLILKFGSTDPGFPPPGEYRDSVAYLRVSAETGAVLGKLGPYLKWEGHRTVAGNRSFGVEIIFGVGGRIAAHPRGFYAGETDRFRLALHAPDGEPLRIVERAHRPIPATSRDVAARREELVRDGAVTARVFPDMAAVQEQALRELPHRKTLPAFDRLLVDAPGNLWVEEFRVDTGGAPTWSVFDPDGEWLGRVHTPAGLRILTIGPEWILGVLKDDLGIERVVLHRLRKP